MYTERSAQYTVHGAQYTEHSAQYTLHSAQYTEHSAQYTVHSAQYTEHFAQYTVHSKLRLQCIFTHIILKYTPSLRRIKNSTSTSLKENRTIMD